MTSTLSGRYLCKYCKVWLSDDKVTRQHHDSGPKHKEAVEALLRAQHEKNKAKRAEQNAVEAEVRRVSDAGIASHRMLDIAASNVLPVAEHSYFVPQKAGNESRWKDNEKIGNRWGQKRQASTNCKSQKHEAKKKEKEQDQTRDASTGYGVWEDIPDPAQTQIIEEPNETSKPTGALDEILLVTPSRAGDLPLQDVQKVQGTKEAGVVKDVIFKKRARGSKLRQKKKKR
eukprot:Plantae.Rhodophyta-Hildenbrandia_rubra.ctg1839.p1 GENE.Plantae.Rhodophyta-Hildenbrandia_rubra.ctg1839~~Plantae.Rhodophyta-Hildenbrandia_rubra.ctg1839.p1  ORF type:complete len:229 (+),score=50.66 Plantae.Rhodophyta-Hildenbrandia_rubra.ctg1839:1431-2117(+)